MSFFGRAAVEPQDIEVQNLPQDSISDVSFAPGAVDLLGVSSWDGEVRIYEVNGQGQTAGKASYKHEGPALCLCWSKDGTKLFSGGADQGKGAVRMFDTQTGQSSQIGSHDAAVRSIRVCEVQGQQMIVSGSWDKTLKYWSPGNPTPVATVALPERVYAMDVVQQLLVVGCAERHVVIFNLANPATPFKTIVSPLRWQTRSVACFPDGSGFALSTVEGRCAISYIDEGRVKDNFTFKCHRKDEPAPSKSSTVYAVNVLEFHPQGTFLTAGGDGGVNIWDKDAKTRIKNFEVKPAPIVATSFSGSGRLLAYATAYDWSQGVQGNRPDHPNKVYIKLVKEDDVRRRPAKR